MLHLTKNTRTEDEFSAYDNLVNILFRGVVWGSNKRKGFVKGPHPAACFMDIPFASLKYIINDANCADENPRYEPYGVVVTKRYAYDHGCRPVLYLSNQEIEDLAIPESELWRVVRLEGVDGKRVNWAHEREWRCKGDLQLPSELIAVLVETPTIARRLQEKVQKSGHRYKSVPKSIIPVTVLCQGLPYLTL